MQAKKKRLTLDMDPAFQRRLKATAALKGVSMRQYCLTAIEGELDKDEDSSQGKQRSGDSDIAGVIALRDEIFGDRVLSGNSADLIREAREERTVQLEAATTDKKPSGHLDIEGLKSLRKELFGDRVFPGNSAELLREARRIREMQLAGDDDRPLSERFREVRKKVFGDRILPGNSADLIREAREIRDSQMDEW